MLAPNESARPTRNCGRRFARGRSLARAAVDDAAEQQRPVVGRAVDRELPGQGHDLGLESVVELRLVDVGRREDDVLELGRGIRQRVHRHQGREGLGGHLGAHAVGQQPEALRGDLLDGDAQAREVSSGAAVLLGHCHAGQAQLCKLRGEARQAISYLDIAISEYRKIGADQGEIVHDLLVTAGGKNVAPQPIENELKLHKFVSEAVVIGDRRRFLSALLVPALEPLMDFAEREGLGSTPAEVIANPRVQQEFADLITEANTRLASFEQILDTTLERRRERDRGVMSLFGDWGDGDADADVDADSDPLSIDSLTTAANGTVVDNGDGTFTRVSVPVIDEDHPSTCMATLWGDYDNYDGPETGRVDPGVTPPARAA